MPYPEMMVAPMRQDLVRIGFTEMKTPEDVDEIIAELKAEKDIINKVFKGQAR